MKVDQTTYETGLLNANAYAASIAVKVLGMQKRMLKRKRMRNGWLLNQSLMRRLLLPRQMRMQTVRQRLTENLLSMQPFSMLKN